MKKQYAVWCSTSMDYTSILNNFVNTDKGCKFERDFKLENSFIDYDHAIVIWYGKEQGELGEVSREENPILEPNFDFIIHPASIKLKENKIDKISYLFAIPDFEYDLDIKKNDLFFFVGNIECERENSSWLDEILNGM
ncbi:hypothetical protein KKJ25_19060 [Xenorhabdus bovienii]|uniref:hypothetical protein n=1 Tax=Xenorhabdus bovienii TaxID=40576 RepID=UPI00237D1011|nr:hypothetical protein [Xenorhabdus bovienii]MDE1496969.1 hypothetical protein [Xenorhabdus bovienii]MDE9474918.1 hypothetical protein [Xenorhabdus bovienii]